MNDIVMVNDANVKSVIAADKPVILAIGASWCPDCRRAQPFFTQLAAVNAERAASPPATPSRIRRSSRSTQCSTSRRWSRSRAAGKSTASSR